ncbi:MAG: peptidylprolyl isomerase [Candidatus Accumulibacter sp.]|jgi:peptidyl-prolyl cis-trans isomerase C|nr:peptidylprolyl isomerase [Accumulibacter sp.]
MHKFTRIAAVLLIGASMSVAAAPSRPAAAARPAARPAAPAAPANVLVRVNGVPIPQSFANSLIAEQTSRGVPDSPELRNAVREELIRRELLLQQAKNAGIDKKPDVLAQAETARQVVFIRNYVLQYLSENPIGDDQLRAEYNRIRAQVGDTEYKTRHILVKEESAARAIIAQLKSDIDKFDELAAKQSEDTGSKDRGGDLGWASVDKYVKPFADALGTLKKGKFTETPVQSPFGYHVILLEDTRPTTFLSFEEVKPRLMQQAQQQQINQMVENLRAAAKVE